MSEDWIKNLGFWITMHSKYYNDGIELADQLISIIDSQNKIDADASNIDDSINSLIVQIQDHGINDSRLSGFFNRIPEYYQKKIDAEDQEQELPEAESY